MFWEKQIPQTLNLQDSEPLHSRVNYFNNISTGADCCLPVIGKISHSIIAESTSRESSSPADLFGKTMRHAGVAVSVTTFTDVIAFFVGTNTLLPGLQSFCVYAAVSIFTIYALQVTHFVAWFSLGKDFFFSKIRTEMRTVFQYFIPSGLRRYWDNIVLFLPGFRFNLCRSKTAAVSERRLCLLFGSQKLQAGPDHSESFLPQQTAGQVRTDPHQLLGPAGRHTGHRSVSLHWSLGDDVPDSGCGERMEVESVMIIFPGVQARVAITRWFRSCQMVWGEEWFVPKIRGAGLRDDQADQHLSRVRQLRHAGGQNDGRQPVLEYQQGQLLALQLQVILLMTLSHSPSYNCFWKMSLSSIIK